MKILALDLATHTGWAHSCGLSGTWDLSVKRDESSGMRLMRLRAKLNEIVELEGINLVVFEAARGGMPGRLGALVVSGELQGVLKLWCEELEIDYKGYSPKEIKKFATGKGNAGKPQMRVAAEKRWPGREFVDDNEVDAVFLLAMVQNA